MRKPQRADVAGMWAGLCFSCLLSWIAVMFHSLNLYGLIDNREAVLRDTYTISAIAAAFTLLAIAILGSKSERLLSSRVLTAITPLAMTASSLLPPLCSNCHALSGPLIAVCGIASGASSGIATVYVGLTLCRLGLRPLIVALSIGQIGAALFSIAPQIAPPGTSALFAASFPPVGTLAMLLSLRFSNSNEPRSATGKAEPKTSPSEAREIGLLIARLSLCVLLIACTHELARTLLTQMSIPNHVSYSYLLTQMVIVIGSAVGSVGIALSLMNIRRISYFFFSFVLWVMAIVLCQRFGEARVRILAVIRLGGTAGALAGILLGRLTIGIEGATVQSAFACMLLALGAISVALWLAFNEHALMAVMEVVPHPFRKRFQDKCQAVARHFGLTEREEEIMVLFAKGRNLAFIQEELFLSRNTISTHRQHIYKKLGIHSQQELLDLVQNYDAYKTPKN
ncbi:helix-turn-helix transcriptional regulator [Parvibacter caecicola]|uniref:helix-turn-helix transcriptional regulator n=1 Tax=Parvibacter caecicola TaxID=747645 RepID=UPI00249C7C7A|nr:LuxR C-terminal-related transcriptional regulator [Parvibacter caecicola]